MLLTRRNTDESALKLDATATAEFHERGFMCAPQISTPAEVALLRTVFDRLFAERAGRKEGAQFDMLGHDSDHGAQLLPANVHAASLPEPLRPGDVGAFQPELREMT